MSLIDPEYFGCASKLSYPETVRLAALNSTAQRGDYGISEFSGRITASVDRVFMCADDPALFASIAINHAINDTNVSLASPRHVMISFEFDQNSTAECREDITKAFRDELGRRSIQLGKCHSSISAGRTSVTISIVAEDPFLHRPKAAAGAVIISRPIGLFKLYYLMQCGEIDCDFSAVSSLMQPFSPPQNASAFSDLSDVSGHGLAGTLAALADRNGIDIHVTLNASHAAHPEVLAKPLPCLQNFIGDFASPLFSIDESSWPLAGLMETAGPIVGLLNDSQELPADPFGLGPAYVIGNFELGTGRVSIQWQQ